MNNDEFKFLTNLPIRDQNNLYELHESLQLINDFVNNSQIDINIHDLKTSLSFIEFFIRSEKHVKIADIRRIVRYVRKLWFMNDPNDILNTMCGEFIKDLIKNLLSDIYKENDLERSDDQLKRCVFLSSLFSDYYDDYEILGISKYDYIFLIIVIESIKRINEQIIKFNDIKADNYYRIIYLLDKLISNWLSNFEYINKNQFKLNTLLNLKSDLSLLASKCKLNFKLISILFVTILGNVHQLELKLTKE